MISIRELKTLLKYHPEEGYFQWLVRPSNNINIDKPAGCKYSTGYRYICIQGKRYLEHRLAFFYMTGGWPPKQIDHINQNKLDNTWSNLRPATAKQNQYNKPVQPRTKSGFKGVHWNNSTKKWQVRINIGNKVKYFGEYTDKVEAAKVYNKHIVLHQDTEFTTLNKFH